MKRTICDICEDTPWLLIECNSIGPCSPGTGQDKTYKTIITAGDVKNSVTSCNQTRENHGTSQDVEAFRAILDDTSTAVLGTAWLRNGRWRTSWWSEAVAPWLGIDWEVIPSSNDFRWVFHRWWNGWVMTFKMGIPFNLNGWWGGSPSHHPF